jgi:hypothetical protein
MQLGESCSTRHDHDLREANGSLAGWARTAEGTTSRTIMKISSQRNQDLEYRCKCIYSAL